MVRVDVNVAFPIASPLIVPVERTVQPARVNWQPGAPWPLLGTVPWPMASNLTGKLSSAVRHQGVMQRPRAEIRNIFFKCISPHGMFPHGGSERKLLRFAPGFTQTA